jgi:membrane-bound metal-dependent hydrolase YbcI (DUF457 family)
MFIGHFGLAFAAKRVAPKAPLPALCAAAQCADLLWPVFLALGLESVRIDPGNTVVTPLDFVSYPYSHSLVMLVVWAVIGGAIYRASTGDRRGASVIAVLIVSHWILDVATHRPDMPLYPGGPKLGFGLWYSTAATLAVEVPLYLAGVWLYLRSTRPRDGVGRWAIWTLVVFLVVAYAANFGGPPPSVTAVWIVATVGAAVILVWSAWADRHRQSNAGL